MILFEVLKHLQVTSLIANSKEASYMGVVKECHMTLLSNDIKKEEVLTQSQLTNSLVRILHRK